MFAMKREVPQQNTTIKYQIDFYPPTEISFSDDPLVSGPYEFRFKIGTQLVILSAKEDTPPRAFS
jgi:hypothetical protein